jgi:hypothetical protein
MAERQAQAIGRGMAHPAMGVFVHRGVSLSASVFVTTG